MERARHGERARHTQNEAYRERGIQRGAEREAYREAYRERGIQRDSESHAMSGTGREAERLCVRYKQCRRLHD